MKILTLKVGQPLRIGERILRPTDRREGRVFFESRHPETGNYQTFDLRVGESRDLDGCGGAVLVHLKAAQPKCKLGVVAPPQVRVCVEKSTDSQAAEVER